MLSISFGFRSFKFPEKGTPSITYKGELLPLMVVKPRIRTLPADPGAPELASNCNPGADPSKAEVTLLTALFSKSLADIEDTDPVIDCLLAVPYATTNTSSMMLSLTAI